MGKVRVNAFSISLDGFGAGARQTLEAPMGAGGEKLHDWFRPTRTFQKMMGKQDGVGGADDDFAVSSMEGLGAWVMGRNMFGPVRGPWPDEAWKGWWGDTPPYHCDVFVLTHFPRAPIEMDGGTVFHFVTDGLEAAMKRARASAGDKDIRIGGGVATVRAALQARMIDEMHVPVSPVLLGEGEALFAGLDLKALGYEQVEYVPTEKAAHYVLRRKE